MVCLINNKCCMFCLRNYNIYDSIECNVTKNKLQQKKAKTNTNNIENVCLLYSKKLFV